MAGISESALLVRVVFPCYKDLHFMLNGVFIISVTGLAAGQCSDYVVYGEYTWLFWKLTILNGLSVNFET